MTVDQIIQEVSLYIDIAINKSAGVYTGADLKNVNVVLSGVNYAYQKIVRLKQAPIFTETVTLDSSLQFNSSTLSKTFLKIYSLQMNNTDIYWEETPSILCRYNNVGDQLTLTYYYVPTDLSVSNLLEVPSIPFDHKALAFYGAFNYLLINNQENATVFNQMWDDAFSHMTPTQGHSRRVKGDV